MEQNREEQIQKIIRDWESVDKTKLSTVTITQEELAESDIKNDLVDWAERVELADDPTSIPFESGEIKTNLSECQESVQLMVSLDFREGLIEKLVKLKAPDEALRLIDNLTDQEERLHCHSILIKSLLDAGEVERARSITLNAPEYPVRWIFEHLLEVCKYQVTDSDIFTLRRLTDVMSSGAEYPVETETGCRMQIFWALGTVDDLIQAKNLALSVDNYLERGRCYSLIARYTSKSSDYLAAYGSYQQLVAKSPDVITDRVRYLNTDIWYKLHFGSMHLLKDLPLLKIEEAKKLLRELKTINQKWADALEEKIDSYLK